MSEEELIHLCARLKRCHARKAEWANEIKAIQDALATELDARAVDCFTAGKFTVSRTRYFRDQLDAKAIKEKAPDVYKRFCVPREVVKLNVE